MAFLGKKLSDLTNVTSASANAVFAMVQDGQTVTAPVSALGCSLKNFTDVTMTSLDVASCMVAAGNIVGAQSIITQACANAQTLSARGELFTCIQYVQDKINVQAGLSAHGDIVTDTGRILSGGININDIITSRLSADKTTTTVDELLQNQALSSFAPITVTLSSNKGLSAENVYSGGAKVCTSESSNLSAVINRGACVPNLTIGLDKGLSGALLPGGGTGFCATSAGLIVGCNNTTPFSAGIDNDLVPGGGSPNITLIGGKNNIIGRDNVSFLGGSSNVVLTGYAGASNRSNVVIGGFNSKFHRANEINSFAGEDNEADCVRNGKFWGSSNSKALSVVRPTFFGGRYGRIRTSLPPTSAQSPLSAADSTIMFGVSNVIEDASDSAIIGGVDNALSGHSTNNSIIVGGTQNVILSSPNTNIIGGKGNMILSGDNTIVIGGESNVIGLSTDKPREAGPSRTFHPRDPRRIRQNSIVIGGRRHCFDYGSNSVIVGGQQIALSGFDNLMLAGFQNVIDAEGSVIIGGQGNCIRRGKLNLTDRFLIDPTLARTSFIAGGVANEILDCLNSIIGGRGNRIRRGKFSTIIGGTTNTVEGSGSTIAGGQNNVITASASFVGSGETNVVESSGSFIGSGDHNRIPRRRLIPTDRAFGNSSIVGGVSGTLAGDRGIIGGGFGNELSGTDSVVVGGRFGLLSGNNSFIGGGTGLSSFGSENFTGGGANNLNKGDNSVIVGGSDNQIGDSAFDATVVGGMGNCALSTNSFIGGGYGNVVCGTGSVIGGGNENVIGQCSNSSSIVGGQSNTTCFATGSSFIGGGTRNTILSGSNSSIIGSVSGTIEGTGSTIIGGCNTLGQGNRNTIIGTISSRLNGENILAINGKEIVVSESSFINIAGNKNRADRSTGSSIQGGRRHFIGNGYYVSIVGGQNNAISATNSTIVGGANNSLSGTTSLIGGGSGNSLSGEFVTILGGRNNRIVSNTDDHVMSRFSTVINGTDNSLSGNSNTVAGSANNIVGHNNTVIGEGNVLSGVDGAVIFGSFNKMLSTNLDFIRSLSSENDAQDRYIQYNLRKNSHNSYMIGHALTLAHRNTTAVNNLTSQCFIRAGASITAPVVSAHKVFSGGVQVCTEFNETLQELVARGSDGVIGGTDVATISSPLVFGMSGMNMGRLAISGHWQRQSDCTRGGSIEQSESLLTIGGSAVCLTEKSSINEAALRKSVSVNGVQQAPLQIGLSTNKFIEAAVIKSCGLSLSAGDIGHYDNHNYEKAEPLSGVQILQTGLSTFVVKPNNIRNNEFRVQGYEKTNIVGVGEIFDFSLSPTINVPGNIYLSGGPGENFKGGDVIIAGGKSNATAGGGDVCILPGQAGNSSATRGSLIIKGLSSAGSEGNVKIECMDALDLTCKTKITNAKSITVCHGQTNCLATISNSAISLGFPAGADSIFLDKNGCLLLNRDRDFSICTPVGPADRSGCDIIIEAGQAGATSSNTAQVGGTLRIRGGKAIGASSSSLEDTTGNVEIIGKSVNLIGSTVSGAGNVFLDNINACQILANATLNECDLVKNFVKPVSADHKMIRSGIGSGFCNRVLSGEAFIAGGEGNIVTSRSGFIGGGYRNIAGNKDGAGNIAGYTASDGTIFNSASGGADIIGGGIQNVACGGASSVLGGIFNRAIGYNATIVGGKSNASIGVSQPGTIVGGCYNQIGQFLGGNYSRVGFTASCFVSAARIIRENAIVGGTKNRLMNRCSFIGAGTSNCILTGAAFDTRRDPEGNSFIGSGESNAIYLGNSTIVGGRCNTLSAAGAFIGGGASNLIQSRGVGSDFAAACEVTGSTIVNGLSNTIINDKTGNSSRGPNRAAIVTGSCNKITSREGFSYSDDTFIGGGYFNSIEGACRSTILNGARNEIRSCYNHDGYGSGAAESTILGGCCNRIDGGIGAAIITGCKNIIHPNGGNSTIAGGNENEICCFSSFIGGGTCNVVSQKASFIGNGCRNVATGQCSTVVNGCGLSATNKFATIIGGVANAAGGDGSTNSRGCYATIVGGSNNKNNACGGFIGGGSSNKVYGYSSVILGGASNSIQCRSAGVGNGGNNNIILGGTQQTITCGAINSILGGGRNTIGGTGNCSLSTTNSNLILGGSYNQIDAGAKYNFVFGRSHDICSCSVYSSVLNGRDNSVYGEMNTIAGGRGNKILSKPDTYGIGYIPKCNLIMGGCGNFVYNAGRSTIIGGVFNAVLSGINNFIGGGFGNTICRSSCSSTILGGQQNSIFKVDGIETVPGSPFADIQQSTVLNGCCNEVHHSCALVAGSCISTVSADMVHFSSLYLKLACIPVSDPGVDGVIYRDGTTLKISSSAG